MLQLEGARMLASTPSNNGQLQAALERAHHLAHAGLEEARRAIGALRDEELPGAERLEQLAADYTRDSGVHTTFEIVGAPHHLDSDASLTLFRVAQEALTNARKHAQPNRVELHLAYEPGGTRLVVQDHRDLDANPATVPASPDQRASGDQQHGYGLTGMRERAELLGGELAASPTDDGFRVELWIPV
jgi:signal transduction histidine kinase